ncbi:MAG: hypothetical protein J7K87_01240 [Candidatus Aenigmarchaeota archaeon]|nr:hypothetical protein [Candidatus Aenigmarchaeota archaeon]
MKEENISFWTFSIIGIIVGAISIFFDWKTSFLIAVIVLVLIGEIIGKKFKKNTKWWLSNGGMIYLLMWIISWVFFFNLV